MPIVPARELLPAARAGGYAVGYFEAWDMQSLDAVLTAAERERSPVILGFGLMMSDPAWATGRAVPYFAAIAGAAGRNSAVPVSLILNEVRSFDQAELGINLGFDIVMLEGSVTLPGMTPAETQRRLVELAHARGVAVEAELGELPCGDTGVPGFLTDPDEAAAFVALTGVDILAPSVGNVHCETEAKGGIDLDRLSAIRKAVDVHISLHGGSGLDADCVRRAIALGVTKMNVGTVLKKVYLDTLVKACSDARKLSDVQKCVGSGGADDVLKIASEAVTETVREFMRLYGSTGKCP